MLKPRNIRCAVSAGSKKRALDMLSEVLADAAGGSDAGTVLEGLVNRERLGSTALGNSVALPHARVPGIDTSAAAFLKLEEPVDFDSPDGQPVDLLFGVLVPADFTMADVRDLGQLATKLRDPQLQQKLRSSDDPKVLCAMLVDGLAGADAPH